MTTILHVDMDAFFVSVEELYDPALKGKPVVVGGRPNERGVVAAASYAARKFGVHSAMPLRRAYRLCPQAIFVEGHPERYAEYSRRVRKIFGSYTPRLEMASIDEAYLDLTGCERLHGPPLEAADRLHQQVKRETELACSIGAAANRLVAKIASEQAKPNGILWVLPGAEAEFLAPLDVRKLPGIGPVTENRLRALGVRTLGELAAMPRDSLGEGLSGLALAERARGREAGGWFDAPVGADEDARSISHETTYNQDTADAPKLEATLSRLSQMVGRRLRENGVYGRTVELKLRYSDFSTITRSRTLPERTGLDTVIFDTARALFRENWKRGRAVRLLGVGVSGLSRAEGQMDLIEGDRKQRWRRALEAADRLRDRYGESSVELAGAMDHQWRERVHENPVTLRGRKRK